MNTAPRFLELYLAKMFVKLNVIVNLRRQIFSESVVQTLVLDLQELPGVNVVNSLMSQFAKSLGRDSQNSTEQNSFSVICKGVCKMQRLR